VWKRSSSRALWVVKPRETPVKLTEGAWAPRKVRVYNPLVFCR
jgi:hypothetical protein